METGCLWSSELVGNLFLGTGYKGSKLSKLEREAPQGKGHENPRKPLRRRRSAHSCGSSRQGQKERSRRKLPRRVKCQSPAENKY